MILSPKVIDQDAKKNLAASWFSTHSGNRAGGTAVLDEGMDYRSLSTTLADAQFAENRLEQIRQIARAFNIPPTMIFELSRGTWSNVAELTWKTRIILGLLNLCSPARSARYWAIRPETH